MSNDESGADSSLITDLKLASVMMITTIIIIITSFCRQPSSGGDNQHKHYEHQYAHEYGSLDFRAHFIKAKGQYVSVMKRFSNRKMGTKPVRLLTWSIFEFRKAVNMID